jgi:hypothetical protein
VHLVAELIADAVVVFLLALVLEAASFLALAEAMQARSLVSVLVLAAGVQVVGTVAGPALSAYVADFTQGSDRTMGFTYVRIGWNVGFTVGVFAGGVLIGFLGFVNVALVAGVLLLSGTGVLASLLDPSPYDLARRGAVPGTPTAGSPQRTGSIRQSLAILARDRPFLGLCAAVAVASLTIGQWGTIFPLYVNTVLGIPYAVLGAGLAVNGLVVVFGQAPMTRASLGHRHTTLLALGVAAYAAAFLLFGVVDQVFGLHQDVIRTLIYLKFSVSGHLTIFVTRTRGPFWSVRPAAILFWAVLCTQALATLIAVYGIFMAPIGWQWALFVWVYALAWFLVNDRVKLAAYKIFDVKGSGPARHAAAR